MVTIKDIAKNAGVSHATVSYVLNDKIGHSISEETRNLVKSLAAKMGYHRNAIAKAMVTGHNDVVAVIITADTEQEFTQSIINGAISYASAHNFSVKLFNPKQSELNVTLNKLREHALESTFLS